MNACILFLLLVYKATRCDKTQEPQTTLIVPEIDDKCKNIKCSARADPICVKIKHLRDIKKVVNVIAINKCEIQFMKCHKDYEAKIVPMKLCGHKTDLMRKAKAHNTTVTNNGRIKRAVWGGDGNKKAHDTYDYTSYSGEGGYKVHKDDVYDEKQTWARKERRKKEAYGPVVLKGQDDNGGENNSGDKSGSNDEGDKSGSNNGGDNSGSNDGGDKSGSNDGGDKSGSNDGGDKSGSNDGDDKSRSNDGGDKLGSNEFIDQGLFTLFSQETIAYRRKKAAHSVTDNTEDCPMICPTQNEMICAKCQHGVYKTFPSTCHLRKFACKYVAESLHLVSRYPCILSAPYIAEAGESGQGKVVHPNDNDIILNFIKCRSLGVLGQQNPRCPF